MKMTARKAVDPIIATLLLIAIAVAAGIIVYVYVNSLAGGLTSGGGQQVSDQLQLDAYNYIQGTSLTATVRDVGSGSVTVSSIFFDGNVAGAISATPTGSCSSPSLNSPYATCAPGQTLTIVLTSSPAGVTSAASGTSHTVKILTATGGIATFTVIAGRTG